MVYLDILMFIISLLFLIKGSDIFVENSARLARHFRVSEFVIGLTLVSIGTSLPELASSIAASFSKESGFIMGNIIGSNIANMGLILAIGTLLFTIETKEKIFKRDSLFLLLITILFILLSLDKIISFADSALLLLIFLFYVLHLFRSKEEEKEIHYEKFARIKLKKDFFKHIILIIFGLAGLYVGSKFLIPSTINLANLIKIPTELIAVSLVAVGTSLPELFVTISAAKKGLEKILIGNIIGSNISNILLIIGISGIISPIKISNIDLYYIMPFMVIMTFLFFKYIRNYWVYRILQGISLLFIYMVFILGIIFFKLY